jgi:hypothetical protein
MTAIGREWLVEQQSQWIDFRNVIDAIIKNDKGVS